MPVRKELIAYYGLFNGGVFFLVKGVFDLYEPGFHRAGIALIALGVIIAPIGFVAFRRECRRRKT